MRHILGPKAHVSTANLIRFLFARAMEIWDSEGGPFRPNFAPFTNLRPSSEHHISIGQGT